MRGRMNSEVDPYQVNHKRSHYAGDVSHDMDKGYTLRPYHSWQQFGGILQPNIVRNIYGEPSHDGQRRRRETYKRK